MILVLGDVPGISIDDLLARTSKTTGAPGVRGPVVDARYGIANGPLAQLREGDKLHIVGPSNGAEVAGMRPGSLADLLDSLAWSRSIRLKQIHFIAPSTGRDGLSSFAALFEGEVRSRGFQVDEIKAPVGSIRCDPEGKIWVYSDRENAWLPSSPVWNYYVGQHVADKHR
jgi:hypothetical protein